MIGGKRVSTSGTREEVRKERKEEEKEEEEEKGEAVRVGGEGRGTEVR